jgi:uncharacterized membrane protein
MQEQMSLFNNLTEEDKSLAVDKIMKGSMPNHDFFMMVILSVIMATLGLLLNNSAIIIGIIFASMITFSMMNFYVKRKMIRKAIKEEEQEIEAEKQKDKEEKEKKEEERGKEKKEEKK